MVADRPVYTPSPCVIIQCTQLRLEGLFGALRGWVFHPTAEYPAAIVTPRALTPSEQDDVIELLQEGVDERIAPPLWLVV